ncbi:MAG: LTA synthase family protein [Oscillospiraceae bacterium]|jgi:hypothetical protein|nr:LTA synthase family protein [Oscillospiraceae bacterium]
MRFVKVGKTLKPVAIFIFLSLFCAYSAECTANGTWLPRVRFSGFLGELVIYLTAIAVVWLISGRMWSAFLSVWAFSFIFACVSWFKYSARGTGLRVFDLKYAITIIGLSGTDNLNFSGIMVWIAVFALAFTLILKKNKKLIAMFTIERKFIARRWVSGAAALMMFLPVINKGAFWFDFISSAEVVTAEIDDPDDAVPALSNVPYVSKTSEEYFLNKLDEVEALYSSEEPAETPDVIIILSESFWDFSTTPSVKLSEEITPNFNALKSEGHSGVMMSRTFAGGTCGVEYEVLTGNIIRYIGIQDISYDTMVTVPTETLATLFKRRGYDTIAMHSYDGAFYGRDKAFPLMGFDSFITREDMRDAPISGRFISDSYITDRIIAELDAPRESADYLSAAPKFIFAITMENHQPYDANRYDATEVALLDTEMPDKLRSAVQTYAQGIKNADAALKQLTDYLRERERPTVVLFFGDHQPFLAPEYGLYRYTGQMTSRSALTAEQAESILSVPFLIWSNYKSGAEDSGIVSCAGLGNELLNYIGGAKPLWYVYQDYVREYEFIYDSREILFIDAQGNISDKRVLQLNESARVYNRLQSEWLSGDGAIYDRLKADR